MKLRPVGAELFRADKKKQKDRHEEANSRFSQFCERAVSKVESFLTSFFFLPNLSI